MTKAYLYTQRQTGLKDGNAHRTAANYFGRLEIDNIHNLTPEDVQ